MTGLYENIYNLQNEPDIVRTFIGSEAQGLLVYYHTWWLPAACVVKLLSRMGVDFSMAFQVGNICLYLWAVIGLYLSFYFL